MIKIKNRNLVGGLLILFIIIMTIIVVMNKDKLFQSNVTIEYPDGCIEKYEGTELVTPECTQGRILLEENGEKQWGQIKNLNLTN